MLRLSCPVVPLETAASGCSASGAANPALRGSSATGAASASLPNHDGNASISGSVQRPHTQHCTPLTRMNAVNTWMHNKMRAQVQDTVRTAPSATMETQFKLVFAQRLARLVCEQGELRTKLAPTTNRLTQTTESHPVSDGTLQTLVFSQRQATLACEHEELRTQLAHTTNRLAKATESHPVSDDALQRVDFAQRHTTSSCEQEELRIQRAHAANSASSAPVLRARLAVLPQGRLAQATESNPVSDGVLQQQLYVQQQETTYAVSYTHLTLPTNREV